MTSESVVFEDGYVIPKRKGRQIPPVTCYECPMVLTCLLWVVDLDLVCDRKQDRRSNDID